MPRRAGRGGRFSRDSRLNELEAQVALSNQSLKQAEATYRGGSAVAAWADRATFLPSIGVDGSARQDALLPGRNRDGLHGAGELEGTWSPDSWGRIRRQTEADVEAAQASAATLASARLSTQASLAQDYIALRSLDEKRRLLDNAVEDYRRTLQISAEPVRGRGDGPQQCDLRAGPARRDPRLCDRCRRQRAQVPEHAIAVLIGKAPGTRDRARNGDGPIPAGDPGANALRLERRPDIASAERSVASATAWWASRPPRIFPTSPFGERRLRGFAVDRLFTAPRFWSLGADVSDTLLDFGQRHDEVLEARAAYDASVGRLPADGSLGAFQQVEDNLGDPLHIPGGRGAGPGRSPVAEAADAAKIPR